jgi:hypothetical protein
MPHSDLRRTADWLNKSVEAGKENNLAKVYIGLHFARRYATKKYKPRIEAIMPVILNAVWKSGWIVWPY